MMELFWLILSGFVSGIVGGMGMGGGTILIPILTIFLGFQQKSAQAINLMAFIPMSVVALIIHIKNKLVDFRVGIPIVLIGILFSALGSYLASIISNGLLQKIFAVFLLMVGVFQAIQTIIAIKNKDKKSKNVDNPKKYKFKIYIK